MNAARTRSQCVALSWLLGALAVGCGADDGASLTVAEYALRLRESLCGEMIRCGLPQASESCAAEMEAGAAAGLIPSLEAAIAAGEVVFDGAEAAACAASVEDPSCALENLAWVPPTAACGRAFGGQVALGGACREHWMCADWPAVYCATEHSCPGVCAERVAEGQPCSYGDVCADGLGCDDGTCTWYESAGAGEACDPEGTVCGGSVDGGEAECTEPGPHCRGHLVCLEDAAGQGFTCRSYAELATAALGEACGPDVGCQAGLSCAYVVGSGTTCVAPAGPGEPCSPALTSMCPVGYECARATPAAERTCLKLPALGELCEGDEASSGCLPPAVCLEGTCAEPLGLGEACEDAISCASGACANDVCVIADLCRNEK